MATMEETQAFENRILERLNARQTVKGLLQAAIPMLAEAIDRLVLQAFRKDDYAVKYAVEPLLESDGPLAALPMRLKLIYALGAISRIEYEDIELLLALHNQLTLDSQTYHFTDDEVLGPLRMLHGMRHLPLAPTLHLPEDVVDSRLVDMQQQRYQQMVRSTLVLSLTEMLASLAHKKAF
ncbi:MULTISPECIES: MltR family transcriptional regulator [Edwardsiella]|uniref:Mannitol operon repressor n=2 Tax=Edwardsiella anguillarum TaxID=1821960 RepID=A0A076LNP1_9GAMM|nr:MULTISPECIES: MltR family transcriptional regulator [Edwardsiella]GAJ68051.1 mannitol repressor [Edwardsiella piscicida]AIJ08238.1 mannitol operon repressor [Edwardsiella anguillarum ET080813]AKR76353.2 MltR family transcriptional regulator [Edwardsiella sp. LADL05-105]KAB0591690.1 MltR family transcriptional regulator [Edwardsiella anguillarum]MDA6076575.1 MltR family transcriptional regulator [Edwardsiella anguillarum]